MHLDHRFTLLIHGRQELLVIADWRHICWKQEPVYVDSWASMIWFTDPEQPELIEQEDIVHEPNQIALDF